MAHEVEVAERIERLETQMETILADLYNHGKDGLKTTVVKFIAAYDAREAQKEKQERHFRWFVGVVLTIVTILVGVVGLLEHNRQVHEGILQVPKIFHSDTIPAVYAETNHAPEWAGK